MAFNIFALLKRLPFIPEKKSVDPMVPSHPAKYVLFSYTYIKNKASNTPATYIKNKRGIKKFLKNERIELDKNEIKKIKKLI